jgi:hypothetical protein
MNYHEYLRKQGFEKMINIDIDGENEGFKEELIALNPHTRINYTHVKQGYISSLGERGPEEHEG